MNITKFRLNIAETELEYQGTEKFLETKFLGLMEALKKSHNEEIKMKLIAVHEDLKENFVTLENYSVSLSPVLKEHANKTREFFERLINLAESTKTNLSKANLLVSTKEMSKLQKSSNKMNLQIQEKMQLENSKFQTMANVIKTRSDAATSIINNIR